VSAAQGRAVRDPRTSAAGRREEPSSTGVRPPGEFATTVARNALNLVAGQVATTALAIVFSAALARSLGPSDFGTFYLITTMATFAYVFVEWGQPILVIRRAAREPERSGELLGTALALRSVSTVAVAIPVGGIAWMLGYGSHTTVLAVALVLTSLPQFLSQAYGMVFRAHDRMGRDAALSVVSKAVALALALPALALGAGIPGVIVAQAVAGATACAVAVHLYRRLAAPPLEASRSTARELVTAGVPILAMTAATYAQPYLDAILLSKLAPATVVGWFGAARNILGTLMAPAVILGAAAYPRLARASSDIAALRQEVRSALRPLLGLGALAATGTYLFAGTAVGLIYGSQHFGPAATILQVFAPGLFLVFIDILFGNIIYATGHGTGFAIAKVASVVVSTALDALLIPLCQARYGNGGIGVVLAFALSEFVVFAGCLFVLRRALGAASALDLLRAVAAGGATVLLGHFAPAWLPFWLAIPLCVGAFGLLCLAVGLIDRSDVDVLRGLLRRPGAQG
jgi:O-antigen/teichoic acid export membrane protein